MLPQPVPRRDQVPGEPGEAATLLARPDAPAVDDEDPRPGPYGDALRLLQPRAQRLGGAVGDDDTGVRTLRAQQGGAQPDPVGARRTTRTAPGGTAEPHCSASGASGRTRTFPWPPHAESSSASATAPAVARPAVPSVMPVILDGCPPLSPPPGRPVLIWSFSRRAGRGPH